MITNKQTLPTKIPRKESIEMIAEREMHLNLFFTIYKRVERINLGVWLKDQGDANEKLLKTSNILRHLQARQSDPEARDDQNTPM